MIKPWQDKYNELLFDVARKFPGESRHETALRYIMQAESQEACGNASSIKGETK